jgi:hypothetical protein
MKEDEAVELALTAIHPFAIFILLICPPSGTLITCSATWEFTLSLRRKEHLSLPSLRLTFACQMSRTTLPSKYHNSHLWSWAIDAPAGRFQSGFMRRCPRDTGEEALRTGYLSSSVHNRVRGVPGNAYFGIDLRRWPSTAWQKREMPSLAWEIACYVPNPLIYSKVGLLFIVLMLSKYLLYLYVLEAPVWILA